MQLAQHLATAYACINFCGLPVIFTHILLMHVLLMHVVLTHVLLMHYLLSTERAGS